MKVAYTIGPYRAATERHLARNIQRAEAVAIELWRAGFAVICPHKNTAYFGGILPDEAWLKGDLEILSRCDFAVTVEGWELSEGSKREILFCEAKGIPVYGSVEDAVRKESPASGD